MKTVALHRPWAVVTKLLLLTLMILTAGAFPAEARVKSNTQVRLPNNLYLGDIDGDGSADFLQVASNRLFAFRSTFEETRILHTYFTTSISRLITGSFDPNAPGRDQVCPIFADGSLQCFGISPDKQALWWWFTQPNFVANDEHAIVGDFDGDGADDILVYKPATGAIRMYTRMVTGFFSPMPGFSLGNLVGADLINKQLRVGEFGQTAGRDDLLVIDPTYGRVSRYDTVTDGSGAKTFWWAFTTATGTIRTDEQVAVANVDGGTLDGLVLRSSSTGGYRMFKAVYAGGSLAPLTTVSTGQLPITTDSGQGFFARLKYLPLEPGGARRDDQLFFDYRTGQVKRTDARYDGSHYTYWWYYNQPAPVHNAGWPATQQDKWAILLCYPSDESPAQKNAFSTDQPFSFYQNLFTRAGTGGVVDYFRDVSYGRLDLSSSEVKGWYRMSITWAELNAPSFTRTQRINACIQASGITGGNYHGVVAVVSGSPEGGQSGANVLVDGTGREMTFLAHEILHTYGLPHSYNDQGVQYGDPWDIMSAMNVYCFPGSIGVSISCLQGGINAPSGPELNAPYKIKVGYLPSAQVTTLTPDPTWWLTSTVSVAALNRPEANGTLMVKIPVLVDSIPDPNHYYAIEFRQKSSWDRGISHDTVLIHEFKDGKSYRKTTPAPEFLKNSAYTSGNVTITVNDINSAESTATVTVKY